jgi:threonine/homoserine/homoserine lactone efflux protein
MESRGARADDMSAPLWVFASASAVIAVSPGPNTLLVFGHGLRTGFRAASFAILGITVAPLIYLAVTVVGLTALFQTWPVLYAAVCLAGAVYLIYLGCVLLLSVRHAGTTTASAGSATLSPGGRALSPRGLVVQGFVTSFSNPKTLLYFTAFLPQFVDPSRSLGPQFVLLAAIGMLIQIVVLLGYTALATATRGRLSPARFTRIVHGIAGFLFVVLGVWLAAASLRGL